MVEQRRPGCTGRRCSRQACCSCAAERAAGGGPGRRGANSGGGRGSSPGLGTARCSCTTGRGAALAPRLSRLGWHVYRLLVLALRRPPSAGRLRARAGRSSSTGAAARLLPSRAALWPPARGGAPARGDGRAPGAPIRRSLLRRSPEHPASACRLYMDGRLAHDRRGGGQWGVAGAGPASAAVLAAAGAAKAYGWLVFLLTDAGDWPRHWYRRRIRRAGGGLRVPPAAARRAAAIIGGSMELIPCIVQDSRTGVRCSPWPT